VKISLYLAIFGFALFTVATGGVSANECDGKTGDAQSCGDQNFGQCDAPDGCCDWGSSSCASGGCCDHKLASWFDEGSSWTFRAGALALERSRPDSQVLMFDTAAPATALNAGDFDFGWRAGYEVSGILDRGCDTGLEIRWMSVDQWNANASVATAGPTSVRINTAVPFFLPGVTQITSSYESSLSSFELNYRKACSPCRTVFAGFRYLEIDEHFQANLDAALLISTYDTETQNRLYGFQVGVESSLLKQGCWSFDGTAKLGLFGNASAQNTTLDTGVVTINSNDRSDRLTFLAELGVTGRRAINCNMDFMVGYNAMWVESATLATDQVGATDFFTGAGIDDNGGVFYHGAFIGFEIRR
jgi:hypothetical protein